MVRNERQRERAQQRKLERLEANTCTVPPGRSILEMLGEQLDKATERYLDELKSGTQKSVLIARGEIRGLARAISLMESPYYPIRNIKNLEQESARRVRSQRAQEQRPQEEEPAEADPEAGGREGRGN